ncbi:hypothetical protein D3C80_991550 [compost metagenome]
MGKLQLFVTAIFDGDHHRLQNAPFTTVDGYDAAAGWRSEEYAGGLFIFEQRLTFLNAIAFLHQHGRAHSDVFFPKQGDMLNDWAVMNCLNRCSGNGQI